MLGQLSNYFSKSSCIFVLKLRRFDKRVTKTGRDLKHMVENSKLLVYDTNTFNSESLFWYHSIEFGYLLQKIRDYISDVLHHSIYCFYISW